MIRQPSLSLVLARDFTAHAVRDINHAHHNVVLVTTTFHDDCPETHQLIEAFEAAAKRGVRVSLLVDTLTYTEIRGSLLNMRKQQQRGVHALRLERRLRKAGVKFHWLGRDSNIGFAGRTHSKWLIADDIVYTFGGVNTDLMSFENTDYMLRIRQPELAKQLYQEHLNIRHSDESGRGARNHQLENPLGTILVDGGLPFNSLIYTRASQLAAEAQDILFVSQYRPTGRLARAIRRCPQYKMYVNHMQNASFLNSIIISLGLFNRLHNSYNHSTYLHAKFIIFTMKDGSRVAITGSHNFVQGSGMIGTREIALETKNPTIIAMLEDFAAQHVM